MATINTTSTEKKMTIAEKMGAIKEELTRLGSTLTLDGESFADFLTDRAEKSIRKSTSTEHKVSAEKVALRNEIKRVLGESAQPLTCTEILALVTLPDGVSGSTSLISGNIKPMLDNGEVVRTLEGKSAKFSLA